jgi:hypothetical protein
VVVYAQSCVYIEFFFFNRFFRPRNLAVKRANSELSIIEVADAEVIPDFILGNLVEFDVLLRPAAEFLLESNSLCFQLIHDNKVFIFAIFEHENGSARVPGELTADDGRLGRHKSSFDQILKNILVIQESRIRLQDNLFSLCVRLRNPEAPV